MTQQNFDIAIGGKYAGLYFKRNSNIFYLQKDYYADSAYHDRK